jgi:hypothetical protein
MRDMTLSPLAIQLGIAAILVLSIAVSTLSFALTSRKAGAAPTIRATSRNRLCVSRPAGAAPRPAS